MERRGVDLEALALFDHGLMLRHAVERCRGCHSVCACEAWLAGDTASGAPDFCVNFDTFSRFSRDEA